MRPIRLFDARPAALCLALLLPLLAGADGLPDAASAPRRMAAGVGLPPAASAPDTADAERRLMARLSAEVGSARCQQDTQCRTLPVGERPCGGPAQWLAYSTRVGRPAVLKQTSQALAELQRARWAASGLMSTCLVLPDPGAHCVAQRCELQAPAGPALR